MKVYVTYHPASVFYGGYQFESAIVSDFRRFNRSILQPPRRGKPGSRQQIVGFDTEYDSLNKLLTVGIAAGSHAIAYETTDKKGIAQAKKVIRHARTVAGHSIPGDIDYLVKLGLAKEKWLRGIDVRDSFLLARMVDENRGKGAYGLEQLLLSEFNFSPWKTETEKLLKKTGNAADWTPQQRLDRCRLDAWATVVLADYFEKKLRI